MTVQPFINEFHYDNGGADAGEFIEIFGAAGTNLSGYSLALYNGNPTLRNVYSTLNLSGVIPNLSNGYGVLQFSATGLQNGGAGANGEPDGIVLAQGATVLEFISYEGVFTAASGVAAGMTSVNVGSGVFEDGAANGTSIARFGSGTQASDLSWRLDATATAGALNNGQSVPGGGASVSISDVSHVEGDAGSQTYTFTVTRTDTSGAFTVDFATANGSATAGSDYDATSGTLTFTEGGDASQTLSVTVQGDTDVEPTETFAVNLSNVVSTVGTAAIADGSGAGQIINDDVVITKIHDVQGTAFFSPLVAAEGIHSFNVATAGEVTVRGVVTAIDTFGTPQGFYISEEVSDWDADSGTSEGIFVRTTGPVSGLTVGETVTVTAHVMEFQDFTNLNRTYLVNASSIVQDNDSVDLPTLVLDGSAGAHIPNQIISDDNPDFFDSVDNAGDTFDAASDALDFYETVEGMRVTITNMVVGDGFVGGSSDNFVYFNAYSADNADPALLNSRGGYTITGDPQHYPVDTADPGDDVNFGGATMTDGAQHGDIIELDFGNVGRGGAAAFDQLLTMGDQLGDVTGIIDFDFGVAKLYVTDALDADRVAALGGSPVQEVTTLSGDDRSLRVATFNVENLSPVGTTFSTNNGVEITDQAKYDKLAAHIATNLAAPDILIIEEVQDNNGVTQDGVTDASTTWGQLVAAVNAATGKHYQWVDEAPQTSGDVGGAPGGNIRVGFLYDTDRVQLGDLAADATLAERRAYTDRIGDGVRDAGDLIAIDDSQVSGINTADWSGTRRSIVGEFTFNGQTVYAFGSHLPSKGGSGEPYQLNQDNAGGQPANGDWALRSTLAEDVWSVQNYISQTIADAKVVSGGDFNEFWFNRPLEVLTGYATPAGDARVGGTQYVNLMVQELAPAERFSYDFDGRSEALDSIISDQALAGVASYDVVHINTGYNDRAGAVNPASSDHDPSLASFDFRGFGETLTGDAAANTLEGFGGDDTLIGKGGGDVLDGGDGSDTVVYADGWTAHEVTDQGDHYDVAGPAGTDTLISVETLSFDGVAVATADAVNDAPIGVDDTAGGAPVVEDGNAAASGDVLANDTDADLALGLGETLQVVGARTGAEGAGGSFTTVAGSVVLSGTYGALTLGADGAWSYLLDNSRPATNALTVGQHVSDQFTYQVADAHGLLDAAQLTVDITGAKDVFTLQLLHFSDAEAGLLAASTAPNLAALVDAFEDDFANSITFASGDLFLPGPFLAAGTDPSLAGLVPGNSNPGRIDISIMNAIGVQASAIGNHEFDLGSNVLAAAITPGGGYAGALFPYLSANLNFSGDSALNPRFTQTVGVNGLEEAATLNGRIAPSAVITEGGEKIGFVGATTQVLEQISSPSGTEVNGFPVGPGPNGEVNDMDLLASQLQPVIDDLISQGVNKIIVVSHLQQIQLEQLLATKLTGVDVIVAGGSNTRLGDADDEAVAFPGHADAFEGAYPLVTQGADGKTTLIVNTDSEFTYLGRLVVDFDANGDIVLDSVTANQALNGAHAATDENVAEAWGVAVGDLANTAFADGTRGDAVEDLTDAVQTIIAIKDGVIFGYSDVYLEGERSLVRTQETNLGDVSADANADAARDALGLSSDHAIVSIKNGGGIRAQIGTIVNNPDGTVTKIAPEVGGEVSQLDVENALRFNNRLMVFDTTAQGLLNILNSPNALAPNNGGFIQIGGVRFSYDPTKPAGSRVQDVVLINEHDQITAKIADNGVVNPNAPALITAVALNFTANGGDGYLIKANAENFRFLLDNGTLSAPVSEALDFTAAGVVPANALGEIQAFSDYFGERYATPETAYDVADTPQTLDTRIQNQAVRTDTVLQGDYLVLGAAADETLNGTAGDETIKGLAGDDVLNGQGGDDVLNGGLGGDRLNGGEGVDTASYADATSGVSVNLLNGRGSFGEAVGDKLSSIEQVIGSAFDDVLSGSKSTHVVHGGDGADIFEAAGKAGALFGDAGDDVFRVEGMLKPAAIDGGEGFDTIRAGADGASITWGAITGVEAINGMGYADFKILGTSAADTIDLSAIVLTGVAVIDGKSGNDAITGSAGADTILGGSGNDVIKGGGGADVITGGTGQDILTGGLAADTFVFFKGDSAKTATTADTITDFHSADGDRIDLSFMDANLSNGAGDDGFTFIGKAAFSNTAGELRYQLDAADAYIQGDVNGDGKADFFIHMVGVNALAQADFIL